MNSEKYTYTDITEIANGAFGTVFRAVQRPPGGGRPLRIVALKKLVYKAATERDIQASDPLREAQTLQQISHANVIQCYDVFELEAFHFLALEFAPVSLQKLLRNTRIPMYAVKNLTFQLLSALLAVHTAGFAHCDIKPSNVLIATSGKLKLADFGQATNDFSQLNNYGTRCYRAPEAVLHGKWGTSADVYSAGLVVFEMMAARQLFTACSDVELIVQQNSLIGPFKGCQTLEQSDDFCKIILEDGWKRQLQLVQILESMCDEPGLVEVLLLMLNAEPTERPSVGTLLENEWFAETIARDDFIQRFLRYQDTPVVAGKIVCGVE